MNKQLQQWFDKFNALNERERISVMLLSAVAIVIIFVELIISPLNKQYEVLDKQIINLENQVTTSEPDSGY